VRKNLAESRFKSQAELLYKIRKGLDLTQIDIAKQIGVSSQITSATERGLQGLATEHWRKILSTIPGVESVATPMCLEKALVEDFVNDFWKKFQADQK
jgi:DNA-binding XRE family transcriptional regulator